MRTLSRWVPRTIWFILTVALVVSGRELPWRDAFAQLRRLDSGWVLTAILANFAILPAWAVEWRLLLPKTAEVSWRRMFEITTTTASVHNALPFFAGGFAGAALLMSRAGLSQGAAISVIAMDQLLVGFAKLSVLAATGLSAPLPAWLRTGVLSLVGAVAGLALVLLPLAHRWSAVSQQLRARPTRVREWLARAADLGVHLDTVRDPSRIWRVAALALAKKALELAAIVALQAAFGLTPSLPLALLVLAALAITTALPIAPANLGVYEATVFTTYRLAGLSAETALGLALVQHVCFLLPMIGTGYITLSVAQLGQRASERS